MQYRSDMGSLCRIAIWIAAALLSVTVLLYFNECKVASSMMLLTLIIGVVNLYRIDKEAKSFKQDGNGN